MGTTGVLAGMGEFVRALSVAAPNDPRVVTAVDAPELWQRVASRLTPEAVILLKGSRGTRLERLIALMEGNAARHPAAPNDQH